MSEQELEPEGASGASEASGAGVLLRALVPAYRLGEVLLRIGELKLTGRLLLSSDMGRRTIYFNHGFPVFSESSLFGERLGAIAVRYGLCSREDVAEALTHARSNGFGLGQSLLELGYLDSPRLFALLGVQLREGVAAACAAGPQRARFQSDPEAMRDLVILRLHPMTAVLSAVAGLPNVERDKLRAALGTRSVTSAPLPALVRDWLTDLGYLGELDKLYDGEPTLDTVRTRLLARHRPGAEHCFDAQDVLFSLPGARATSDQATPAQTTDLVVLCLLLSGSVKLATPASSSAPPQAQADEPMLNTAEGVQRALDRALEQPVAAARASLMPPPMRAVDQAVIEYLHGHRDRALAAVSAVWGPSVEAADAFMPAELMQLYLTLKPEKRPAVVLDVSSTAAPENVMHAYARRTALLSGLAQPDTSSVQAKCRAAELTQCFDDALQKLLPGTALQPGATPLPAPPKRPSMRPSMAGPGTGASAGAKSLMPSSAGELSAAPSAEALAAKIEGLLRASNWQGVLDTLDATTTEASLPFTLRIARAMAQRELKARHTRSRWRTPIMVAAGFLCGLLLGMASQQLTRMLSLLGN